MARQGVPAGPFAKSVAETSWRSHARRRVHMLMRRWRGMHGIALGSGLVLVAGAAGMAVAASGGSGTNAAKATLSYTCQFPSGPQPVSVQVAASFPAAVPSGQPITPGRLHLTAVLPRAAVGDLTKLGRG